MEKQEVDSSSEDEMLVNMMKEVIDKQFVNDTLYSKINTKIVPEHEEPTVNISNAKSLRTSSEKDKFTNFGVTPGFQAFVANKLDEMLERTIELTYDETTDCCMKQQQKRDENSSIKLLSTSENFVTTEVKCETISKKRKSKNFLEDDDAMSKFREAAVDPEFVLSKSDTKAWTSKHPEPDFKYKRLKNGTLIEQK